MEDDGSIVRKRKLCTSLCLYHIKKMQFASPVYGISSRVAMVSFTGY